VGYGLDRGREHVDQAAANCCSGLVPAPEVPGTERLTSRRPSEVRHCVLFSDYQ
jgi:hypothetical protein